MAFTPLHDRVLVRRVESDEKTAGGLIIPESAKEKPQQGEVVAVGPGGRDDAGRHARRYAALLAPALARRHKQRRARPARWPA